MASRYEPVRALLAAVLLLFAATSATQAQDAGGKRPPNILLIVADDLGYTDLGCYGAEIATPHIDALAKSGVKFTSFHTSVSCSPTRSMLMTGVDNHVAGLGNMNELLTDRQRGKPGYEGYLNNRVVTLAEVLRAGGYHTYMAGKWHLGSEPDTVPYARGFERTFTCLHGGASHWSDMTGLQAVNPIAKYSRDGRLLESLPEDFYSSRSYADFLMQAIRANRGDGKPFVAYYAPTAPHDPIHCPEPWLSKYRGRYDGGYEALKKQRIARAKALGIVPVDAAEPPRHELLKAWSELDSGEQAARARTMEVYAGMIENLDYHVGRILQFLRDIGEYENTVIIFTSDNGPHPWDADHYPSNRGSEWFAGFDNSLENIGRVGSFVGMGQGWASASAGPLDYFKMTVGEGGIRTPFIVAGPGVTGGRQTAAFAHVTDVMPTLLAVAGVEPPRSFRGRDVAPMRGKPMNGLLAGTASRVHAADSLIGGEMRGGKWMRQGDFKVVLVTKPYGPGEWRLYDIVRDPGETNDLSAEKPDLFEALKSAWERYAKDVGVVAPK